MKRLSLALVVLAGCPALEVTKGRYACNPTENREVGSAQCPGASRCGLEGYCHDIGNIDVNWKCESASDCESGWQCGVGDDGTSRECHDPNERKAFRCLASADCSAGWTCGLDTSRLRRCLDPMNPTTSPCELNADCVAGWQCGLNDLRTGRECHDPTAPRRFACAVDTDCLASWTCGLSTTGMGRECHDPQAPERFPCVVPTDCVAGWQCGRAATGGGECHDPARPEAWVCTSNADCLGGWQCGLNNFRTGRECHDPAAPRSFACQVPADCLGGWQCGLTANRLQRECHDPAAPQAFACDTDGDCVGEWRCSTEHLCSDGRGEGLSVSPPFDAGSASINPLNLAPLSHLTVSAPVSRRDTPWVAFARGGQLEALRFDESNTVSQFELGPDPGGPLAIQSPYSYDPGPFGADALVRATRVYSGLSDGGLQTFSLLPDGGWVSALALNFVGQPLDVPITRLRQSVAEGDGVVALLGFSPRPGRFAVLNGPRRGIDFTFIPEIANAPGNQLLDMANFETDGGPNCVFALDERGLWVRQFMFNNSWDFEQVHHPIFGNSTCGPSPLKTTAVSAITIDRMAVTALPRDGGAAYVAIWNLTPMLARSLSPSASYCTSIAGEPCTPADAIPFGIELGPCQPCRAGALAAVTPVRTASGVELEVRCSFDGGPDVFTRVTRSPFGAGQCETRSIFPGSSLVGERGLRDADQYVPGRFVVHNARGQVWLGEDVSSATSFSFDRAPRGVARTGVSARDVLVVGEGAVGVPAARFGLLTASTDAVITVANNEPQWVLSDNSLLALQAGGATEGIASGSASLLVEPRSVSRVRARSGETLAVVTNAGTLSSADVGATLAGTQGAAVLATRVAQPSPMLTVAFPSQMSPDAGAWVEGWATTGRSDLVHLVADGPTRWRAESVSLGGIVSTEVWYSGTSARAGTASGVIYSLPSRLPLTSAVPAGPVVDYQEACGHVFALTGAGLLRLVSGPGSTSWVAVPTQLNEDFSGGRLHVVSNELYVFSQSGDAERLTLACP